MARVAAVCPVLDPAVTMTELERGLPVYIRYCRHRSYVGSRRAKFKANSLTVVDSFHACKTCGRTEVTNPELDFRIAGDGNEYCGEHLPASNAGT